MFWTAASNLWVLSAAVQYYVSPLVYFVFSLVVLFGIVLARVFKQKDTDL